MTQLIEYFHFFMILQPLLYALQLFTYRGIFSRSHSILGIYMILISLYFLVNAHFLFSDEIIPYTLLWVFPLLLSFNPFYYFYVRSLTDEKFCFKIQLVLHFLPSIVTLIVMLSEYFFSRDKFFMLFVKENSVFVFIYYAQIFVYTLAIVNLLIKHKKKIKDYFSYTENISLSWLWIFVIIYITFAGFDIAMYLTIPGHPFVKIVYYVIMIVFVNFLGFFGIKQADIYLLKLYENQSDSLLNFTQNVLLETDKNNNSTSGLSDDHKEKLFQQIKELIIREKLYLNYDLTIITLAKLLNSNYKYISQVINEKVKTNFYNFINEFRVQEAVENMKKYKDTLTLDAIAHMSGFRSRSTFINAFKRKIGVTPGEFLKNLNKC